MREKGRWRGGGCTLLVLETSRVFIFCFRGHLDLAKGGGIRIETRTNSGGVSRTAAAAAETLQSTKSTALFTGAARAALVAV